MKTPHTQSLQFSSYLMPLAESLTQLVTEVQPVAMMKEEWSQKKVCTASSKIDNPENWDESWFANYE